MSILLISHKFSPNNSVGARRWSKFYKYLKLNHIDIKVITQNRKHQSNNWGLKTIEGGDIIKINSLFYNSAKGKITSKIFHLIEIVFFHKLLRFTDEGYLFNIKAYFKANKLIKKGNITHLVATCPSNSTAYFAAKLKKKHPHLYFIIDFRDAWMQAYETYNTGYNHHHYLYKKEKMMEHFATTQADLVISVVPEIVNYYKNLNKNCRLITNGFDTDDFPSLSLNYPNHILKKDKINLCHFGTLDFGRETEFLKFVNEISKYTKLNERLNFILIGNINSSVLKAIQIFPNISHCNSLNDLELNQLMYHTDIHLSVNDYILYYAYGSKVFDAFLYKKPIIFITKKQSLSEFIENNGIGITVDTNDIDLPNLYEKILDLVKKSKTKEFTESYSKKIEIFDLRNITKQLIDVAFKKNN